MDSDGSRDEFDPESHYDELGIAEWERLDRDWYHRLEWERTVEYLDRFLPDEGRILDVGGGAGRYTVWLAERGYDVTLVDISERQLEIADRKLTERGLHDRAAVERGDVRALSFDDDAFDATLCLGAPLSHVLDEGERHDASGELARVSQSGAPVFVSVVGRLALLQAVIQQVGDIPDEDDDAVLLPDLAKRGTYDQELLDAHDREPTLFPAHFFRVDELESLLSEAGLDVEKIAGLEGIASLRRTGSPMDDVAAEKRRAIETVIEELREDRAVADLSTHILAVARAPAVAE